MNKKERAMMVAERVHSNQPYDIYPYTYHLKMVAKVAEELGYDESIIVSCILHDAMEDTGLSYNDIKKAFGFEVAEIVYAVTDELGRNRKERKRKTYPKIRENWKATAVKICDRIANITQSMKYNEGKLKTYISEHDDFVKGIQCDSHPPEEINKAWRKLNILIHTTKHNGKIKK